MQDHPRCSVLTATVGLDSSVSRQGSWSADFKALTQYNNIGRCNSQPFGSIVRVYIYIYICVLLYYRSMCIHQTCRHYQTPPRSSEWIWALRPWSSPFPRCRRYTFDWTKWISGATGNRSSRGNFLGKFPGWGDDPPIFTMKMGQLVMTHWNWRSDNKPLE